MASERRVTFLISANVKEFTKGLNKAQRSFRKFGRKLERSGRAMTRNITVPLATAAGLAVNSAADFENSFADIRKTVDTTEQQFGDIEKGMRDMAKTIPTSVDELNRMGGVAGQLGVEAENIVEFTETIAKLGDTTDIAGEQAALSLSRFMNVMGTAQSDIDRLGSTIVGLGNNFAAMESEIVEIATSMAPLGNSIGLTEQQVLSFATTIAASGGQARAASTAFQKTANTMKQAVITGNKDLETFASTAGMTASEFQEAFQRDAAGALQAFLEGLRRVQVEGGSMAQVLDEVGLADQRLVREFGKVVGNLDDLEEALGLSNEEWIKNEALTEEAQKRYETFTSRLQIFRNRLNDVGILIGNMIIPHLTDLMDSVEDVAVSFSNMSEDTQRNILKLAGVLAIGGPLMIALGAVSKGIGAVIGGLKNIIKWSAKAGEGLGKLATALNTSRLAILGWIGAIAALGVANYKANQRSEERRKGISDEVKAIESSQEANEALIKTEREIERLQRQMAKGARGLGRQLEDLKQRRDELIDQRNFLAREELDDMQTFNTEAQQMVDNLEELMQFIDMDFSNMDFGTDTGGGGGGGEVKHPFAGAGNPIEAVRSSVQDLGTDIANTAKKYRDNLSDMMASGAEFSSATRAATITMGDRWESFKDTVIDVSDAVKSEAIQQIQSAVLSFGTIVGKTLAGVENSFATTFEKVVLVLLDFAKSLVKLAAGIGSLMLFIPGMQGVGAGVLAASAALQAVISGVEAGIKKRANNRQDRRQGMARGGIVPAGFPNDTYPAMLSSGERVIPAPKPLSAGMGGKQVIENRLFIGGREVEIAVEEQKYKRSR